MKTIHKNFRRISLILVASFFLLPVAAQTTNTGYFMKSQHSRTSFNPALRPEQGFLGFPGLSNLYIDARTNTFNLEHFVFPGSPKAVTFLHETISYDQFMKGISDNNFVGVDVSYQPISMGFYKGNGFWTVDLGVRAIADVNIPYDVFKLAKQGFADENGNPVDGYNFKNIRGTATSYAELGVGHSRPFLDNTLIVGLKAKVLLGLADMDFHIKQLALNTGQDEWTVESEAALNASLRGIKPKYDENGRFSGFEQEGGFGLGGFGLGFDLGASYKFSGISKNDFLDKLTFSAAFTDIGFISWSGNNSMSLATNPATIPIAGNLNITFDGDSLKAIFDPIVEAFKDAINLTETDNGNGRTTSLRMNMNLGLEYEIIKNKLSAGILSTTRFNPSCNLTEFTLAGRYKPAKWFEAGLSYSFVYSKLNTFGLALNIVPAKVFNLFLAGDYIIPHWNSDFIPTTTKAFNFQFGVSIPLGKKRVI